MTPLCTRSVKWEMMHDRKGSSHLLSRGQPDVAGISDFALSALTNSVPSLSQVKRDGCLTWCPGFPECLLFFVENISGPVLFFPTLSRTKLPLQMEGGPWLLLRFRAFPQDKRLYPQLYEFLPYSYLSQKLFLIDPMSHDLLIKAPLKVSRVHVNHC